MLIIIAEILSIIQKVKPVYLVIMVLVGIIIFQRACQYEPKPCPEQEAFDTSAFIASLPVYYKDTTVYKPKPYPVYYYTDTGSTKRVEIPANIDSFAVAEAFFQTWILQDTILNDTNGLIVVSDIISKNKIQSRVVSPKIIYPHYKFVTKTVTQACQPRFKVFVGGGLGGWVDKFGASAKVLFQTKQDRIYGISYDPINKFAEGSIYWKIKAKNR